MPELFRDRGIDRSRKIAIVVNEASYFISHRLPLALEARSRGDEVLVICGKDTGEEMLEAHRVRYRTFDLSRSGFNPIREFASIKQLRRIYTEEQPDLVHHVTIKPIIYGTPAARWENIPAVVNAVPGLGFVFTRRGIGALIRRLLVNLMYRLALDHPNMRLIFQNREDMTAFLKSSTIPHRNAYLIRGSGVDLNSLPFSAEPDGGPTFVLVARMLKDKGVREFVEAARAVRRQHPNWRFWLAGDVDSGNPSSLLPETLAAWQAEGVVEWMGHTEDVAKVLSEANVACLPSYREGLPKSLLEAAAIGRAIITTNVPGCREVVTDDVTGLLVEPRDPITLAEAMLRLGANFRQRQRLALAARKKAEAVFSIEDVVNDTFLVYDELLV
ncbi:MAG: glycosyltransferase family 4 protein [Gammaproteobacteria bacterium]|nr:glycosyltransferase family 4 protein [Gammaproteobacteria bacterium]